MKRMKHVLILLCLCLYAGVSQAQVTIGDNSQPNSFSVLELISNQERGLRLPQLTTAERDVLDFTGKAAEAKGLMIFNTTTNCVETWNGTVWIGNCACEPTTSLSIKANTNWQQHRFGASFVFSVEVDGSTNNLTIDWYVNDQLEGTTTGNNFFFYNPGEFGSYVVQAKVNESCSMTSTIVSNLDTVIVGCGAYVQDIETQEIYWLVFMCHNLGADTSLDPFTPAAGLHGAKYRFGAKEASLTMAEDQSNAGIIPGWTSESTTAFPYQEDYENWSAENNPCPPGWRLPTLIELSGVINTDWNVFSGVRNEEPDWEHANARANFVTGAKFGKALFLPASGARNHNDGVLEGRGSEGRYWSSSYYSGRGSYMAFGVGVGGDAGLHNYWFPYGLSVRCVAE